MSDQLTRQFLLQIPVHKLRVRCLLPSIIVLYPSPFIVSCWTDTQQAEQGKFPLDRDILIGMVEHTQIDWDELCSPQNAATKAVAKWLAQPENVRYIPEAVSAFSSLSSPRQ